MVMTAQPASLVASTMAGAVGGAVAPTANGAAGLEWLRPAVEIAAPARGLWHSGRAVAGWARPPRVATRTPGEGPGAVKAARDFAGATLRRWGMADLDGDVGVVVSELLTNAFRHALPRPAACQRQPPIRLGLFHPGHGVLCAVADPSDQIPVVKQPDYFAETGRGLHVIASLSDRWGWTAPNQAGKVVWAMFSAPADH
jgi:histidine kinase-like protein